MFTSSLCDFFYNEGDPPRRVEAWAAISDASHLFWPLVIKRVPNVGKVRPADWDDGSGFAHVCIVATVVTQEVNRDVPRLVAPKERGLRLAELGFELQIDHIVLGDLA